MSDLSTALVPVSAQSVVPSSPQRVEVPHQPRLSRRRRRQQIPSSTSPTVELSFFVRFVTNRPVSFLVSPRGVIMDPNGFNGYNSSQNNYPNPGFTGSQGQGGYNLQQQQFMQNQNQHQQSRQTPGGFANVNHYHGNHFNFTFSNSGAYDLNVRIPGLIGGRNNEQPQQSIGAPQNPGLGFGNNLQSQGFGGGPNYGQRGQQPHPTNLNQFQQHQQYSDFYNPGGIPMGQVQGVGSQLNGQGYGFSNSGHQPSVARVQTGTGTPLRRTHSTNTLLSDEFPDDDDCCFGSQNSIRR